MIFRNYVTLLSIGVIWGSQFIFQKAALLSFSPIWIGASRALIGAITLIVICKMLSIKSSSRQWCMFALIGLLEASIPLTLLPWAQQNVTSSMTAILMGTIPFYALLLAPIFIKGSKISACNIISVIIGFSGLLILFYPTLSNHTGSIDITSVFAVIVAAMCFATALLLLNRIRNEHPIIVARNALTMASIQLIIIACLFTPFEYKEVSASTFLSLLYLGMLCSGIVYFLYMVCIKNAGAVFASMTNYIVPVVGVLIGSTLGNESIHASTWIALGVILSALFCNQMFSKTNKTDSSLNES